MEDIEITCPNCKIQLPTELKRVLMSGATVTCENCGVVLVPKVQGEPSQITPEKAPKPTSVRETIRQAFREAKASVAAEMQHTKASLAADLQRTKASLAADLQRTKSSIAADLQRSVAPAPAKPVATVSPATPASPEPPAPPASSGNSGSPPEPRKHEVKAGSRPRKGPKRGTPEYIAARKQEIEKAKRGLRAYNAASLVLMRVLLAIFYIASIGTVVHDAITGKPFLAILVQQAPLYIIGAFLHWYETHRIHEWVKQGVYEFYGIDMIVVGILGCIVCGIGVLMLIKGFIVMGIMIAQDEVAPKSKRDALISWINGLDEVSWYIAALTAAFAFIFTASSVLAGIFKITAPSVQFVAFIIMGICGIVAANSDFTRVSKHCREYKFEGLGGESLVYGILGCICFGAGVPMLVKAILLFALDGVDKKTPRVQEPAEQTLPRHDASLPPPLRPAEPAATGKAPEPEKAIGPPVPAIPVQAPAPVRAPLPARKKDPSLPPRPATSVEAFLQRNFNVLTPRARKRLLKLRKLGVGDDDIETIAEELVHHPEFQQLDIIDEYIQLNKADEVDPMHVLSVRSMSYDENTKKWMLDQLRSIPDKDVPAFIDEMKRNQPTP